MSKILRRTGESTPSIQWRHHIAPTCYYSSAFSSLSSLDRINVIVSILVSYDRFAGQALSRKIITFRLSIVRIKKKICRPFSARKSHSSDKNIFHASTFTFTIHSPIVGHYFYRYKNIPCPLRWGIFLVVKTVLISRLNLSVTNKYLRWIMQGQ